MDNIELLANVRPLTQEERQAAQAAARAAVIRDAGEKPSREQFKRELGSIFTPLDYLALAVFVPALLVSSVHIIQHMGALAAASLDRQAHYTNGTVIHPDLYVTVHQWALIPLAEASMLLFLVMYAMNSETRRKYVYLGLAIVALVFVAAANVQSGISPFESVLPAIFTIGVGFHLENLIVRLLKRRDDINNRYEEALLNWEVATANPEQHAQFRQRHANALKDALIKANRARKWFKDNAAELTNAHWRLLVKREFAADQWLEDEEFGDAPSVPLSRSGNGNSGSTAPMLADPASIKMTAHANGRGGAHTEHD